MFIKNKEYLKIKEFEKHGVEALFTTKTFFENNKLENLFPKNKIIIRAHQTHTNLVVDISEKETKYFFEGIDGFITKRKDVVLTSRHADCLAIFFYDKKEKVIGLVHSGWKGSYEEIGIKALDLMKKKYNSNKKNIVIGIGVGISWKNYEVGEEFYEKFKKKFDEKIICKSFINYESKIYFDNYQFNKLNFIKNGISNENIVISDECTYEGDFFSYRKDKIEKRNYALIYLE